MVTLNNMKKIVPILFAAALFCCTTPIAATAQSDHTYPPQYGKPFTGVPDRRDVVLYQVNTRSFSKEGKFTAVTARLDSIKALGVNMIYLMPIYPVGKLKSTNSPYATRDYNEVGS